MKLKLVLFSVLLICFAFAKAQLGFCTGESGVAIFSETFGAGITAGPPLAPGVTSYNFQNFAPNDGEYTITSTTAQRPGWLITGDHTGDANGKMLLVNASFNPGLFYRTPISGLCENTPYEFSAWILNILRGGPTNACAGNEVPIEVRFEIWDATDTILLASGAMAPQFAQQGITWVQYGLTFTSSPGQSGVILKMINQGRGGCGNDLAIDDIAFRTCGDATSIATPSGNTTQLQCQNDPAQSFTLNANTTTSVFATPAYQWQESIDGVVYTDIVGATNATFVTGLLTRNIFYRVKVAEDAVNLTNSQCVNFSDPWEFDLIDVLPPVAVNARVLACDMGAATLEVLPLAGETYAWFSTASGGIPIATGSQLNVTMAGTFYVEATNTQSGCPSTTRTAIQFIQAAAPDVRGGNFEICPNENVILNPVFAGGTYLWSSGETTQTITVTAAGSYTCIVTNSDGCEATAVFNVSTITVPIIASLEAITDMLTITTLNAGNFQYSIDGINYQTSNVFNINGLLEVTVRVRNVDGCDAARGLFTRINVPDFFTPNNDGFNDRWEIGGVENFPGSRLEIYDRFGKLLKFENEAVNGWDGTFNGQPLPSSDYWYKLYYNNEVITGHMTLKR